jgi:molybdopterin molybdotransferase
MRDIALSEALELCGRHRVETGSEAVPVRDAAGRVLAEDVRAAADIPTGDSSAMDGWAVRAADTPGWVRVVGEHRAGHGAAVRVTEGTAVRISTGALVPEGADAVVRLEECTAHGDLLEVPVEVRPGRDVRRRGEVIMRGVLMLAAGTTVTAAAVTSLGAVGLARVAVRRRPRVAVIGLGDELVPLGGVARPGEVYDSNRFGVAAQAEDAGAEVISCTRVGDDPAAVVAAIRVALAAGANLVVTIGGASVGPHDHVRPSMEAAGVRPVFHGVRVRPCRPVWLGAGDDAVGLALPGNPASAAIAFHLFGRVLLGRGSGWRHRAPLSIPWEGRPGTVEVLRCGVRNGTLHPLASQAPHAVTTIAFAEALALVEGTVAAGTPVPFTPLDPDG